MNHVDILRKMGYQVHEFTQHHCRVEDLIDLFVGKRGGSWHDLRTGMRGKKPSDQFPFLIESLIGTPEELRLEINKEVAWSERKSPASYSGA